MPGNPHTVLKRLAAKPRRQLLDYWELGRLAARELDERGVSKAELADRIGIEVSTLRVAIKGANCLTKTQVRQLERLGVAWRGMMDIIGCADHPDFDAIVERIITERIQNSTEIRNLIASDYGKDRLPRIPADAQEAGRKAEQAADGLDRMLRAFHAQVTEQDKPPPKSATRRLRQTLERLAATIKDLQKAIS